MSKFLDKMMNFMKLNDDEEEFEMEQTEEEIAVAEPMTEVRQLKQYKRNNSKIVNIHTNIQMEVIVIHPESYDEAQDICDHIRSKRPVVINLETMERDTAQRIMDFISGACYSLNGNLQRVTNNIFIIAPDNVDIAGDFKEELKTNGIILPWKKE
ncbi:cell division inhibitor SepF [Natranaerovirga pectinivora]|uniref:Cell division protein SepF n=1 Tax=Natranaerovirga pectinivora TaxID=682400 RepID=A0A4R3MLG9_9FIRM|nr:cell division protein SepF [Natranaerovirga pectinivora]TCT14954.1 cell division inhibitor SepF [Natranaerovirga pectinivora]